MLIYFSLELSIRVFFARAKFELVKARTGR
jgi:hypothetical protein